MPRVSSDRAVSRLVEHLGTQPGPFYLYGVAWALWPEGQASLEMARASWCGFVHRGQGVMLLTTLLVPPRFRAADDRPVTGDGAWAAHVLAGLLAAGAAVEVRLSEEWVRVVTG